MTPHLAALKVKYEAGMAFLEKSNSMDPGNLSVLEDQEEFVGFKLHFVVNVLTINGILTSIYNS